MYDLEQVWKNGDDEGFYVLQGGSNWAGVEGYASEWLAIAEAIRKRGRASFRRCAVAGAGSGFVVTLWSPRNAASASDHVELDAEDADALADRIEAILREACEACIMPPTSTHACA